MSVATLSFGLFLGGIVALVAIWRARRSQASSRVVRLALVVGAIVLASAALSYSLSDNRTTAQRIALFEKDPEAAMSGMAEDLEAELEEAPDAQGYFLLGRARESAGQRAAAVDAFARANELSEEPQPDYLAAEARARLATAPPGSPSRRIARQRAERALDVAPQHMWAHYTLAALLMQEGEAQAAVPHLQAVLDAGVLDQQSEQRLRARIAALQPEGAAAPTSEDGSGAADTPALSVEVDVVSGLEVEGGTLFIFARQAEGPPMPIAARRILQPQFPITIALRDQDRLQPGQSLHSYSQLEIGARWSSTGTATGNSDDPVARVRIDPSQQQRVTLTLQAPQHDPKG